MGLSECFRQPHSFVTAVTGTLALEGDASPETDGAVAVDALLLEALEEMSEVRVGGILLGADRQDLGLMTRCTWSRLVHIERKGSDVREAPFAAAAKV